MNKSQRIIVILMFVVLLVLVILLFIQLEGNGNGTAQQIVEDDISIESSEKLDGSAPIGVNIKEINTTSTGTQEVYIVFMNKSNMNLAAFSFYVQCYDAYGKVIYKYGKQDYEEFTYDDLIKPYCGSAFDLYWKLNGFEDVKSIRVAISKYKLEGESVVTIPYNELDWEYKK